ncbi:hypothetical protein [Streptomyces sp. NPDC053069]|uniref:hypothetical protein n=1 Tax=Streptomyces sp. NPDC053069 TaxID=3365695 RepID=UPI0037D6D7C5
MGSITIVWAASVLLNVLGKLNLRSLALSPDGRRYLIKGSGRPVAMPFAVRWALPALCRDSPLRWRVCTDVHLVAVPVLMYLWLGPYASDERLRVVGALLVCGLPGLWRIHIRWPVSVDATALAWALGSALLVRNGQLVPGVLAAVFAGLVKETSPVFAACFAWSPLPLAGLLAPAVVKCFARVGPDPMGQPDVLANPFLASRLYHVGRWFDPRLMAAPWGICLLAFGVTDRDLLVMLAVTAAVAYGQIVIATDTVRLYQWAAPPVIAATITVVPSRWAYAALAAHLLNPWAGKAET